MKQKWPEGIRYAVAILAAIAGLYLRRMLTPLLGESNAYHTMWLPIVFAAWYCGVGPAIAAALVGVTGIWYWILAPVHSFTGKGRDEFYGVVGFLLFSGLIIALGEANRRGAAAQAQLAAIVESSSDVIISKDLNGIITSWNGAAAHTFGWTAAEAVGQSIILIIPPELREEEVEILRRLRLGERIEHFETMRMTKAGGRVPVSLTISPIRDAGGRIIGASKIARDISVMRQTDEKLRLYKQLEQKNVELRRLAAHLQRVRDDERRALARDLHDSTGQNLTVLAMELDGLKRKAEESCPSLVEQATRNKEILNQISSELRTISYLLHPPLLDELGLHAALRWYAEGLAERGRLTMNLELDDVPGRLPPELETSLFRIVQECLTNIHKHTESPTATVRLRSQPDRLLLEVADEGAGIPPEKLAQIQGGGLPGIGLRGMRERVQGFNGEMEILSGETGTTVRVVIPLGPLSASD